MGATFWFTNRQVGRWMFMPVCRRDNGGSAFASWLKAMHATPRAKCFRWIVLDEANSTHPTITIAGLSFSGMTVQNLTVFGEAGVERHAAIDK